MQKIIFTDLDGTLLDYEGYSYEKAKEALEIIKRKNIPLIICTSKTKAEIEFYKKKLKNNHPFISENGGAIFIPKGYFDFRFDYDEEKNDYFIIKLGMDYEKIIKILKKIKAKYPIKGFSDMVVEEIAEDIGLPIEQAKLAKKREFDEVFKILDPKQERAILKDIKRNKLNYVFGGRFYHINNSDKGKAVRILSGLFRRKYEGVVTIGIGDSENDFDMLDNVDKAYLVKMKDGIYASEKYNKAGGIGPEGWNRIIKKELKKS